jgi:hypothetical protein
MAKKQLIRLTESDLHRIIKESVNNILSELDYKTYANAEKEASKRADANYWRDKGEKGFGVYNKAAHERMRADRFGKHAQNAFDRDYGYKTGDYWDSEGYAEVGLGGDFNSTEEFAPHAVGYRSKGYGNPAKYEHGWSDSPMGHMEPEEFFNTNPEAAEAYRNADAEWKNYKKGNYDYQKGKGWVKK